MHAHRLSSQQVLDFIFRTIMELKARHDALRQQLLDSRDWAWEYKSRVLTYVT